MEDKEVVISSGLVLAGATVAVAPIAGGIYYDYLTWSQIYSENYNKWGLRW